MLACRFLTTAVRFDWKTNAPGAVQRHTLNDLGFVAQEIEKVLPELVHDGYNITNTTEGLDAGMYKAVSYRGVIPILVEAVKQQQNTIHELRADAQKQQAANEEANRELRAALKLITTWIDDADRGGLGLHYLPRKRIDRELLAVTEGKVDKVMDTERCDGRNRHEASDKC